MSGSKEVTPGVTGADLAALGLVVAVCSPWLAVVALGKWATVTAWCAEHGLLVPAEEDPVVALPRADGVGFDAARLLILGAAVLAVIGLIAYLRYRWRMFRRARLEWRGG